MPPKLAKKTSARRAANPARQSARIAAKEKGGVKKVEKATQQEPDPMDDESEIDDGDFDNGDSDDGNSDNNGDPEPKSSDKAGQSKDKAVDISSDGESDIPAVTPVTQGQEEVDKPLLRAPGINYAAMFGAKKPDNKDKPANDVWDGQSDPETNGMVNLKLAKMRMKRLQEPPAPVNNISDEESDPEDLDNNMDFDSEEDEEPTAPNKKARGATPIPELQETRISKGYSRRPVAPENKYIATMSEALARARAEFGDNADFMEKLARQCLRFHYAVPDADSSGKPASFAHNLKVRRIKATVTKALKEVNETGMCNNHRMPTAVEILALRYCSPKGEGNPSVNAMLAELGMSHLSSGRITDDTNAPGSASTLATIRAKAEAAKNEADDMIKWVTKNDPRLRDLGTKVERIEQRAGNYITHAQFKEHCEDVTDRFLAAEDRRRKTSAWLKEHTETWEMTMHRHVQERGEIIFTKLLEIVDHKIDNSRKDGETVIKDGTKESAAARTKAKVPKTPAKQAADADKTDDPFECKSEPRKLNPFEGFTRSLIKDKEEADKRREKPVPPSTKPSGRKRKVTYIDTEDDEDVIETPSRPAKRAKATPAPRQAKTPASKKKTTPRKSKATADEDSDASIDLSKYK